MARSFVSLALQAARAADRAAKAQARAQARAIRDAERDTQRRALADKRAYVQSREEECGQLNAELEERLAEISSLLSTSLSRSPTFTWNQLIRVPSEDTLDADPGLRVPKRPINLLPRPPGSLLRLIPGVSASYERRKSEARAKYQRAEQEYQAIVQRRAAAYNELCETALKLNKDVENFRSAYQAGHPEAVAAFAQLALDGSELPDGFHRDQRVAFLPESRQLVVEYRMPTVSEAVPAVERYKYVKARDVIDETRRSQRSQQRFTQILSRNLL